MICWDRGMLRSTSPKILVGASEEEEEEDDDEELVDIFLSIVSATIASESEEEDDEDEDVEDVLFLVLVRIFSFMSE